MERLMYELRPYACALIGLLVLFADVAQPGPIAGGVLIAVGVYIHMMRKHIRDKYSSAISKRR